MKNIDETIGKYFDEWKGHIEKIPVLEDKLELKKQILFDLQQKEDAKIDYKVVYGYNNEKTRKAHYKKVLTVEYAEIEELEQEIDYSVRRISFIKHRIQYLLILKGELNGRISL